ncbi:MAG: pyridoxine 5'-phosphate synthase [Rubricoccaceae bacterium]|nr:pyridoxine 5'-phosphate synthase [Rubricoccaceae bacterium]
MTRLSVNLNKVALVRNARSGPTPGPHARPDLHAAAEACVRAGAHGLTLHPRPDGRHALAEDVAALADWLAPPDGAVELNVEGNPFAGAGAHGGYRYPGFLALLEAVRPTQATLVPDTPGQRTSDHGWTLGGSEADRLRPVVAALRAQGSRVSLFVDPHPDVMARAAALGADRVELYTGPYADAFVAGEAEQVLPRYAESGEAAREAGLGLNAGHDLDRANLGPFLRAVPGVLEVSIGQALVADALHLGLEGAVRAFLDVIARAPGGDEAGEAEERPGIQREGRP